jgi:MinD superfamily P-loop ATPase
MEIAVISGKGGTGKSSISAAFASLGDKVVLADCDVDAANLFLLFNPLDEDHESFTGGHKAVIDYSLCTNCRVCIDYCRFDAVSIKDERVEISAVACDGCFLCSRICPENAITMVRGDESSLYSGSFRYGRMVYGRLAPGEENTGKLVNMVRQKAKEISSLHDIGTIILDGPPGIGCPVISTVSGVDKVVIVTEPTGSGLSDLQRAAGVVAGFGLVPSVIINKSDLNPDMTQKIVDWCAEHNIRLEGILPFGKEMVGAMVSCKTITEYDPENSISIELKKIWTRISNEA